MPRRRTTQTVVLVLFVSLIAYASASGPNAGYTGAPGDIGACTACHDKASEIPNTGPGSINISNAPEVYEPGAQYTLVVTVAQAGRQKFGFQLTAIDGAGARAGTLNSLGPDTQINAITGLAGRQYIQHTSIGTFGQNNRSWQIRWTAPSADVGTVRFFAAGNAADGNGNQTGSDFIYTVSSSSESPTTFVTLSMSTAPDGLVLEPGDTFTIEWSATNSDNVNNFELRYSTDDGATFPITNLIFTTTDSKVNSAEWTVPDTPSSQARIRLQAGKKSGLAVELITGRFTISRSADAILPLITSAKIKGKKLIVTGENFQQGAQVEINGIGEKTKNQADFPKKLKCKKGGAKIEPGSTVSITVLNPDTSRSEPFLYTRPN